LTATATGPRRSNVLARRYLSGIGSQGLLKMHHPTSAGGATRAESRPWPESRRRLPAQGPEGATLENQRGRDGRAEGAGDTGALDREGEHEEEPREREE